MAIEFVAWGPINTSGGNQNFQNSGGNVTPALPSGIQAGDLIVLFCMNNDGTNATAHSATGYDDVHRISGSITCKATLLTKVATSSESNPTVVTSGSGLTNDPTIVLVGVFRNVLYVDSFNSAGQEGKSNTRNTSTGTIFEYPAVPPQISEGWDNGSLVIVLSARPNDYGTAPSDAGGYTIISTETSLGSDSSLVAGYQIKTVNDPPDYAQGDFGGTAAGNGTQGSTSLLAIYYGVAVATKPPYSQVVLI